MDKPTVSAQRTIRTFAAGAGCGFLAGAFVVATVVWHFGNVIGSRPGDGVRAATPSAAERWVDGVDDAGAGVIEAGRPEGAVATSGTAPVVRPAASPEPVLTAPLAERAGRQGPPGAGRGRAARAAGALVRPVAEAAASTKRSISWRPATLRSWPIEEGKVARLFFSKAGGITVYQFDPTEQYCYYYAHLERYADGLVEGQELRKGQVIGYVGTTGNAPKDTPHLHFAIFRLTEAKRWWEGTPIDPYDVLR